MVCPPSHRVYSGSTHEISRDPSGDSRSENARQICDPDAFLFHRIAVAQRDRVFQHRVFFAEGFEIDRNAEWRPNFVLATITPADRARFVVENKHVRAEKIDNLLRL